MRVQPPVFDPTKAVTGGSSARLTDLPNVKRATDVQEGGSHYKDLPIQPIEYILANSIPYAEGCVIKYVTRWRAKGGVQDLKKAKHFLELLIEHVEGKK